MTKYIYRIICEQSKLGNSELGKTFRIERKRVYSFWERFLGIEEPYWEWILHFPIYTLGEAHMEVTRRKNDDKKTIDVVWSEEWQQTKE